MNLDFLNDLNLEAPKTERKSRATVQVPIEGDFRVFRNGGIEFTDAFRAKVNGKWIDVVFTSKWDAYPKDKQALCFININTIDKPAKADIKKETKLSYIKEFFLTEAAILWGINWEVSSFVDFKLEDTTIDIKIAALPKFIQRGDDKGDPDYVRRENVSLIPITPSNIEDLQMEIPFNDDGEEETADEEPEDIDRADPIDDDIRTGM